MDFCSLSGKKALVTGASGGIGAEIARALHQQGAWVTVSGRKKDALEELAASLGNDRVFVAPADLSNSDEIEKLVAKSEELMGGGIDILVNNAGLTRDNLAIRMKDQEWDDVLKVDLESPFRLSRTVLKGMVKRRSGRIISISSIVGATGNPGQANYAAAKAGMIGMSKALALEVASRGITVNVVAPGFIDTSMTENLPEAVKKRLIDSIPLKRLGTPKDVASSVVFLASEEASWITGVTFHVNGGMAMI
ncbi:3-oxoacyl-[acyl-carrier-protein] reductase [Acetobacteraceae bacterium]|nr:3-oxoacyl-[acyl-carrier-protein] reductase [Acetobacteraceae bacterium]